MTCINKAGFIDGKSTSARPVLLSGGWTDAGSVTETASSVGDAASEAAGEAVSGLTDEGGIILIPLVILLVVLFGGGIYLIYEAPVIISEAAFEAGGYREKSRGNTHARQ